MYLYIYISIYLHLYLYLYIYVSISSRLALPRYLQRKRKFPRLKIVADRLRSVTTTECYTMTHSNFLHYNCDVCRAQFVRGWCKVYFANCKRHTDHVTTHNVHVQSDLHRTMHGVMPVRHPSKEDQPTNQQTHN